MVAGSLGTGELALCQRNPQDALGRMNTMKVFNASFTLASEEGTEVSDITKLVRDIVQNSTVTTGIALVNTMHTTCALFINEFQAALIDDLKGLTERLVPERGG